ncbi:ras-related protein Rab-37-like isoform X1 [Puntigrus tetrazona]|uniref:ras-related protein Rab-37-like isoform X1 n=1 Tax=Puntigrus tetrazona TaxID=1606681 RepID=UPI001C89B442|nr:ras-related protein Rab-37-like isoform X1 [Puntigrus tetrazona]
MTVKDLLLRRASHMELMMENTSELEPVEQGEPADPDSAYGSSPVDTDTEEGHTLSSSTLLLTYNEELMHKTILVGDSGVGKTSLLVQFDQGKFIPGSFSATVGIGFTNKVVTVDNMKVKLQIWDTAGQERFRSVTHAYYRDAQALLLLYDITRKSSFDNIRAWLTEIYEYAQKDVVIMLLGNKSDMAAERVITHEEGEKLAKEYGVPFMETSAKTGVNVELAFHAIARELKHRNIQQPHEPKFKIHDYIESQKQKSNCCGGLV